MTPFSNGEGTPQRAPASTDPVPVIWTDVLQPYGTAEAADKPIAAFGAIESFSARFDQETNRTLAPTENATDECRSAKGA